MNKQHQNLEKRNRKIGVMYSLIALLLLLVVGLTAFTLQQRYVVVSKKSRAEEQQSLQTAKEGRQKAEEELKKAQSALDTVKQRNVDLIMQNFRDNQSAQSTQNYSAPQNTDIYCSSYKWLDGTTTTRCF